jgi:hypothetical protein
MVKNDPFREDIINMLQESDLKETDGLYLVHMKQFGLLEMWKV